MTPVTRTQRLAYLLGYLAYQVGRPPILPHPYCDARNAAWRTGYAHAQVGLPKA